MKAFRRLILVFLLLCSLLTWGEPVKAAAYDEYQGLQVMVNTDKETYQDGEAITLQNPACRWISQCTGAPEPGWGLLASHRSPLCFLSS